MHLKSPRGLAALAVLAALTAAGTGTVVDALGSTPAAAATSLTTTTATQACPSGAVPEAWMLDVPSNAVAASAVNCLAWWGVTVGDGSFHFQPGAAVSRGEMALFLSRLIRRSGGTLPAATRDYFPDDNGTAYEQADNDLAQAGIVRGLPDGDFAPTAPVTRAQMARFLYDAYTYRATGSVGTAPPATTSVFPDVPVSAVFAGDIQAIVTDGFASGYPDGTYRPAAPVTRAQMALFLTRVLQKAVQDAGATPPAATAARPGLLAYVADGTRVLLHALAGSSADTVAYTAPTGAAVTATAVSPDGRQIAVAVTHPGSGGADPTGTAVVVVPVAGGTPVTVDGGKLGADVVVHLSWAAQLLASAVSTSGGPQLVRLDPTGTVAPVSIGGAAGSDCRWAESLPAGPVVYSGCTSVTGGGSVVLGSLAGNVYGPLTTATDVQMAVPSPEGTRLAMVRVDVSPADGTVASVQVAPSILGAPVTVASVSTAAGSPSIRTVDAVAWADHATLVYSTLTAPAAGGAPSGGAGWQVPAAGGSSATALSLSGTEQWALSALPTLG